MNAKAKSIIEKINRNSLNNKQIGYKLRGEKNFQLLLLKALRGEKIIRYNKKYFLEYQEKIDTEYLKRKNLYQTFKNRNRKVIRYHLPANGIPITKNKNLSKIDYLNIIKNVFVNNIGLCMKD